MAKRNVNIDICKGVVCWLVIWGHTIQYCYAGELTFYENVVFRFIYGFHMPFFMIISGYLFCISCHKYDFSIIIRKQICHIAYPLFIWNGINWLCIMMYKRNEIHTLWDVLNSIYESLTGLWFLWSILIISIFIAIVYFNVLKPIRRVIGYILVFLVLVLLPAKVEPCKTMNIWMYPYFLTGFLLHEKNAIHQQNYRKIRNIKYVVIILYPVLLHYFHFEDYIYTSGINPFTSEYGLWKQIEIDIFRWLLGYVGIFFMIVILQLLFQKTAIKRLLNLLFGNLGHVTLQIYVMQRLLLEELFGSVYRLLLEYRGGVNILVKNTYLYNIVLTPLIGLIHLLIIYKVISLIKRRDNLYKFLFGESVI